MTDPAEIAAKLTPAQIRALVSQKSQPYPHVRQVNGVAVKNLVKLGLLTELDGTSSRPVSPLGRAVLAALDAKEST